MSRHRYSLSSLFPDSMRAMIGIASTLGPLAFLDLARPLFFLFAGLGAIFVLFALKVLEHGLSQIEVLADEIVNHGPFTRRVNMERITKLKLARYASPRRQSEGWYQLTLGDHDGTVKVDSTIDGFEDIVAAAVSAAEASQIALDLTTEENLRGLGFRSAHFEQVRHVDA